MKVKEAKLITGTMTRTSKMPGLSYSLPAWECQTGSKLRKVKGTPCFGCYALKGNYTRYPAIRRAQYKRLASLVHDSLVTAMVTQVKRQRWFRWHDAGDVQSVEHMNKIMEVCRQTPGTSHWLPTQERRYLPSGNTVPNNLVIRLSGSKVRESFSNVPWITNHGTNRPGLGAWRLLLGAWSLPLGAWIAWCLMLGAWGL